MTDWKKDWDDLNTDTDSSKGFSDTRRMNLIEGANVVRIVAKDGSKQVVSAWVHYFMAKNKDGSQRKTKAVCLGLGNCPICDSGNKAKHEFYFNVIDRVEQKKNNGKFQVKLLQQGISIADQIKALANDEEYGNPINYNIKITRKGKGKFDTTYMVQASRKNIPLTKEEINIVNSSVDEGGAYDLSKFLQKRTKAELLEMLGQASTSEETSDISTIEENVKQVKEEKNNVAIEDDFDIDKEFAGVNDDEEDDF